MSLKHRVPLNPFIEYIGSNNANVHKNIVYLIEQMNKFRDDAFRAHSKQFSQFATSLQYLTDKDAKYIIENLKNISMKFNIGCKPYFEGAISEYICSKNKPRLSKFVFTEHALRQLSNRRDILDNFTDLVYDEKKEIICVAPLKNKYLWELHHRFVINVDRNNTHLKHKHT